MFWWGFAAGLAAAVAAVASLLFYVERRPYDPGPFRRSDCE